VRPKYACHCCVAVDAVVPLLPLLIPHSKLGLGLDVHIVLTRFDDHLSYYRIEQQFRERHLIDIPRQQMVQWMEHIAHWLEPVVDRMWQRMLATGYLQVDETPVQVLDPEVHGKAARGYLWFYAVPGGDVVLEIWDRLKSKAEELHSALLPKSTLGKAVSYFLNDYQALTGYLKDGRFEIDNNLIENSIRPTAVGRRRWLFIGHPDAGWRSAVIYSVLVSCRRRGINPQDYLTDILARLP